MIIIKDRDNTDFEMYDIKEDAVKIGTINCLPSTAIVPNVHFIGYDFNSKRVDITFDDDEVKTMMEKLKPFIKKEETNQKRKQSEINTLKNDIEVLKSIASNNVSNMLYIYEKIDEKIIEIENKLNSD